MITSIEKMVIKLPYKTIIKFIKVKKFVQIYYCNIYENLRKSVTRCDVTASFHLGLDSISEVSLVWKCLSCLSLTVTTLTNAIQ